MLVRPYVHWDGVTFGGFSGWLYLLNNESDRVNSFSLASGIGLAYFNVCVSGL